MPSAGSAGRRADALNIFESALKAADPGQCISRALSLQDGELRICGSSYALERISRLIVVGAGKATPAMASAVEGILGARISAGAVNTKYGHALPLDHIATTECGHPFPDEAGVAGSERMLSLIQGLDENALVIGLFSGGGSALMPAPAEGISLAEKQEATRALLACGATIDEINTIRKHLSRAKGGLLARRATPARIVSLLLSDVVGDPLDTIASGPTCPDSTSFGDCLDILDRYRLRPMLPAAVLRRLEAGARNEVEDTPKVGDSCFARSRNHLIGNNLLAIESAVRTARALGYNTLVLSTRIQGEAREVAAVHAAIAQEVTTSSQPVPPPACVISGGETTVTLSGRGKGGRSQELALAAALRLENWERITLLSAGTDGSDGPTDAAGAIVDGTTADRARQLGLSPAAYLADNDSYHFFKALGDLVITGPTNTNVMDLQIILAS